MALTYTALNDDYTLNETAVRKEIVSRLSGLWMKNGKEFYGHHHLNYVGIRPYPHIKHSV
jgi:hypothetical protein